MIVDLFMVYQFIRRLATPFVEWDAYKLGIIDAEGNVLIKRKDFKTDKQRSAFGIFDVMILNMKKLLAKLPGGSSKIASYAAALYLIREWKHFTPDSILTEDVSERDLIKSLDLFSEGYFYYTTLAEDVNKNVHEDGAPANAVGGGNIAGMGVGPQGEPGLRPRHVKSYKERNKKYSPMPKLKTFKQYVAEAPVYAADTIVAPEPKKMNSLIAGEPAKSKGFRKKRLNKKHTRPTIEVT